MIRYKVVERADPRDLDKPKKYYAAPRNIKIATFRDFIDDIADRSIVSTPDIVAVMESLFQLIPTYLSNGRIIKFGDLGTFTIKLVSEGQDTEEEVNAHTIKNVIVRFIPSKLLREKVNTARFVKYNPKKNR